MDISLDHSDVRDLVLGFLHEDIGRGDVTTESSVSPNASGRARIEAREPAVIAGLPLVRACFELADTEHVEWQQKVQEGGRAEANETLVVVEGRLGSILTAERTALNLLGHLSGIATLTARFVSAIEGTRAKVVDTRKTTPGLRALEKYAVRVGGGTNHRSGLDDGVLIKDNHIAAAGGITPAVKRAKAAVPHGLKVEVEVEDIAGLEEAMTAGADVVLLDNMTVDEVRACVERAAGEVLLEASGGISLDNVAGYAATGVDLISVGALTHSAPNIDVALEVES
jgi:nicotinate-nucleotide pyrophosphorylase (carboxylating)